MNFNDIKVDFEIHGQSAVRIIDEIKSEAKKSKKKSNEWWTVDIEHKLIEESETSFIELRLVVFDSYKFELIVIG